MYSVLPVLFIMTVTGIKDAYENYRKERSDDEINSQAGFHHLVRLVIAMSVLIGQDS